MHKIVIDTNILVSAPRSRLGASHRLIRLIGSGKFELCVSVPLVLEYENTIKRLFLQNLYTEDEINDFIDYICSTARKIKIFYLWRPYLQDAKDDKVLELAVTAESDIIITFNTKDFKGIGRFGIMVMKPQDFLRMIGEV